MAKATRTGVGGSVTVPAGLGLPTNMHVFEWTLDLQHEVFDDSDFSTDTNAREKVGGMYHGVGSLRATADRADAASAGAMLTEHLQPTAGLVLIEEAAYGYTFAAILTNIIRRVVKTDRVFYDVNFESSGDVVAA